MSFPVNVSAFHDPSSNFTIPYNTWYDLSNELATLLKLGFPRLETQMVATMLTTVSTAVYTVCAVAAAKALIAKGFKTVAMTLLAVMVVMYAGAFVYWATVLAGQFRTFHKLADNLSTTSSLVSPLDCFLILSEKTSVQLPAHCSTIPDVTQFIEIEPTWDFTQECAGTVALALNVTLGDAIVWWRVWVLWTRTRLMLVLVTVLLLATLSFGITDASYTCSGVLSSFQILGPSYGSTAVTAVGSLFTNNGFGFIAICLSLFSNTASTSLVGYRAWKHRRDTRVLGATKVEGLLTLLIESGLAYCVLWTFILGSQIAWIASPSSLGASNWSAGIVYFTQGCLIAFVGLYPTLIIALVAMNKSRAENQSSGYSLPTPRGTFPLSPLTPLALGDADLSTRSAWSADSSTIGRARRRSQRPLPPDPFAKSIPSARASTHMSEDTVHDGDGLLGKESFML
ncbi:hypothetical protein LXA43DRAFT_429758 [Ganoderma leucocontextum]|nr:hypothetical protein LXA43DRAFT_429758 [Ganoderma leucocontextum]